jgi:DNA replication protein DnaC
LIIDYFGLTSLEQQQRLDLLEIIEDRHGRKSTIIASQLPVSSWYEIIGEETIADFERREHEKKKAVSPE